MEEPEEWRYILDWFYQLHTGRSHGFNGPCPLTYGDIINWRDLLGVSITPFEVRVIKQIDEIFLTLIAKEQAKHMPR